MTNNKKSTIAVVSLWKFPFWRHPKHHPRHQIEHWDNQNIQFSSIEIMFRIQQQILKKISKKVALNMITIILICILAFGVTFGKIDISWFYVFYVSVLLLAAIVMMMECFLHSSAEAAGVVVMLWCSDFWQQWRLTNSIHVAFGCTVPNTFVASS